MRRLHDAAEWRQQGLGAAHGPVLALPAAGAAKRRTKGSKGSKGAGKAFPLCNGAMAIQGPAPSGPPTAFDTRIR